MYKYVDIFGALCITIFSFRYVFRSTFSFAFAFAVRFGNNICFNLELLNVQYDGPFFALQAFVSLNQQLS